MIGPAWRAAANQHGTIRGKIVLPIISAGG
jgi:hypothetical protein